MKMARMARQSIEAGQPIHMPPGMRPVIELPNGPKSTIVTITPDQTIKMATKSPHSLSHIDQKYVTALSASQSQSDSLRPRRSDNSKFDNHPHNASNPVITIDKNNSNSTHTPMVRKTKSLTSVLPYVSSVLSDESTSNLTDPYLDYIGGAADDPAKEGTHLENTFAAKLTQTLQADRSTNCRAKDADFLMSDGSSDEAASSGQDDDDDLEDLENLEDGDLPMAPFANPSESWLLPDTSVPPLV